MNKALVLVVGLATLLAAVGAVQAQAPQPAATAPTFSRDVAPILYKHCVSCHRPGEAAPMSLLTYEQARPYARAIATAVANRTMPPWHVDAPAGTFHNERLLAESERKTLIAWAAGGASKGEATELPPAPAFAEGWTLGAPDVVFEMPEEYKLPATGTIRYEWFYLPTNFTEAKWIESIEIRPGNRQAVHHALVYYLATPDPSRAVVARPNQKNNVTPMQDRTGQVQHTERRSMPGMPPRVVATYAPGTNPQVAPAGTAFRLEAGGIFELNLHYTTIGTAAADRTKIGITFSDEPAPTEIRAQTFLNGLLKLPAGASNEAVSTDIEFVQDAKVWGLFPHTHVRGKKWDYTLQLPNGETRTILAVPRYDFNWQTYYLFKEPLQVPKGSKIISTAWYDNSAANKSNPDPKVDVLWGDQTWEEMQYTGILLSPN